MKTGFLLILFFSISNSFSQKIISSETWILDKTIYENGNDLEVNHPLYSTFSEFQFFKNSIKINNTKFNAKYIENNIILDFREIRFSFDDEKLLLQEKGDNKIQIFLKKNDFINKYPKFKSEYKIVEGDTLFYSNAVFKPKFQNELSFEDFLRKNISSYSEKSAENAFFQSEFIITKDNKIKNVTIFQGISKKFDSEFLTALERSEFFLKNETGKDLIVKHSFTFFKTFNGLTNKSEKEFYSIQTKGNEYFENNNFEKAIAEYEKLNNFESVLTNKRFRFLSNEAFIKLGISNLALSNLEDACIAFKKVGGETEFSIRNYLINFCK